MDLAKRIAPDEVIMEYNGEALYSASGRIKVLETIQMTCQFATSEIVDKAVFIVTKQKTKNNCIIGRDIIERIPTLKAIYQNMQTIVEEMTSEIESEKVRAGQSKVNADPSRSGRNILQVDKVSENNEILATENKHMASDTLKSLKETRIKKTNKRLYEKNDQNLDPETSNSKHGKKKRRWKKENQVKEILAIPQEIENKEIEETKSTTENAHPERGKEIRIILNETGQKGR